MRFVAVSIVSLLVAGQLAEAHAETDAPATNTVHHAKPAHETPAPAPSGLPEAPPPPPAVPSPAQHPVPALLAPAPGLSPEEPVKPGRPEWYQRWVASRLEIGTRYTNYKLKETQRGGKVDGEYVGTFLGSLSELEDDQDSSPNKLFIQYKLCPYSGLGVSYDHVRAVTMDSGGGDGTVDAAGPIFYVTGCYHNKTRATPYCEIGYVMYNTSFEANSWGAGGRTMTVQDSSGLVLAAGLDIRVWQGVSAGLYYRHVDAETVLAEFEEQDMKGDFPIANDAYGLTLKYIF